jgi:AcrR family transcriptional regulator
MTEHTQKNTTRSRSRRQGGAAATRAAMLEAARVLFTRDGYDHVGVRDVAAVVGVDPALIIRYFGSKEKLFAEAVAGRFALSEGLLEGERSGLGERLARYVLSKEGKEGEFDPLLALLRSAPNERAAALLREALDERFVRPLARWMGGERAEERAGLIVANLFGLAFMRSVLRSEPLVAGETEHLIALVAPVLQSYVDGTPCLSRADAPR